ncbi:MAG: NAD+ synthase [Spartobacteria bacterium]|nr:NAD+ synthase [Spartobacteria bacterium]
MKCALVQVNTTVGAIEANGEMIVKKAAEAEAAGAQLVLFPELTVCGYPPEDLILKPHFVQACMELVPYFEAHLPRNACVIIGSPWREQGRTFNAALVFIGGKLSGIYRKNLLPNYGVFDEKRVFAAGDKPLVIEVEGKRIAVHICEDSWVVDAAPCLDARESHVDLVANLSASPFHAGKIKQRRQVLAQVASEIHAPLLYCNLVGAQDELVFDGGSKVVMPNGDVVARAGQFNESILYWTEAQTEPCQVLDDDGLKEVYEALKTGLRDYVNKNGFRKVIVALSGGIDSALVVTVAVDALGAERVMGLTMPSMYSSGETLSDALLIAKNLNIEMYSVPIKGVYDVLLDELQPIWDGRAPDVTEENLQARIRGNMVMALSNKFGALVLSTGNKSEMAVGYCTIYGDMCGGYALIKDVPKTMVFALCRWRNEQGTSPAIPPTTIERPPSAELRPDQKDSDSLPDYDELDAILSMYVEEQASIDAIIAQGFADETVRRVARLVDINEYKRRQAAPGVKITPRAFGRDRRIPITNHYRG